jgi:sugar (pentulose or hexulose) kinase
MGCALAVAVALGVIEDYKDIKKVVKVRKTFEPRAEPAGEYARLYGSFRKLYPGLSKICGDLNRESHPQRGTGTGQEGAA